LFGYIHSAGQAGANGESFLAQFAE
jgi:hypothetical protein